MKVILKNIGIVKNSEINLDGLTVITGENNSGKTTVGKVVYSLFDAVSNIQMKAENDKIYYIQNRIDDVARLFNMYRMVRPSKNENTNSIFGEGSILSKLFINYKQEISRADAEKFAHEIYDELSKIDINNISEDEGFWKINSRNHGISKDKKGFREIFQEQLNNARYILVRLFEEINKDADLIDYARESINQTLRVEFSDQIQPVAKPDLKSKIELRENGTTYFEMEIINNKIVNNGKPVFIMSPYQKTYFIDDPFIIDQSPYRRFLREHENDISSSFVNADRILQHNYKLNFALKRGKRTTVFEETVLNAALSSIKEKISQAIPGEFVFNSEGDYYVQNGNKLKVSNLATGSKMFSILKILLDKGEIDNNTMLILDEPEAHLHSNWQNKFAELIVLLVKELNVNILLTTHSSNFMLAVDAFMRKYDITSKSNFYQTKPLTGGFVEYKCVNDDMGNIYADFMHYLSEVKMLRNEYIEKQED